MLVWLLLKVLFVRIILCCCRLLWNVHVVKAWSPNLGSIGWSLGCVLEGDCGTQSTSSFSFSLPGHDISSSALPCIPHHPVLLHYRPKSNWANQSWTQTSQIVSQNKPFLLISCLFWGLFQWLKANALGISLQLILSLKEFLSQRPPWISYLYNTISHHFGPLMLVILLIIYY